MGRIRTFIPERLIMGVLTSRPETQPDVKLRLANLFGPIERETTPVPFLFTDYYNKEMGVPIQRLFLVFGELVDPSRLSWIKLQTNLIEEAFMEDGQRKVNLDPGILSADNLILATTKDRSHRIPLADGIFGEVTLIYTNGAYQSLPWTYADYKSEDFRVLFKEFRTDYLALLRQHPSRGI
jgi:hypothetical protein